MTTRTPDLVPDSTGRQALAACGGTFPGDPGYDEVRTPWNVAVDQRPAVVCTPTCADDVVRIVRAAAGAGLRVAVQGTGHGAAMLARQGLDDVVLLNMRRMPGVRIDPEAVVARVEAGALWEHVTAAAGEHRLAAPHGSSPDVGVVGLLLGGGLGWYSRRHGLACNRVVAFELVTADGELLRVDETHEPDLFWALRGGGGSFGVVTAVELRLLPIPDAYAGAMIWGLDRYEEVLRTWQGWCVDAPEVATTALRALRLPPLPDIPRFLRGRSVTVLDGAVLADDESAAALMAPFRALRPEIDMWTRTPAPALVRMHMDPEGAFPAVGGGCTLDDLSGPVRDAWLAEVGAGASTHLLVAELRQLGGALARPAAGAGCVPDLPGSFHAFCVAAASTRELAATGLADVDRATAAVRPAASDRDYITLSEDVDDVSRLYTPDAWQRLREIRTRVDPAGRMVANHPVPLLD